ncbi:MAG TPA: metal-binding protein [Chloroflexia bacterium]|nr:metal-binding protein [Chloroflexia bacterium]
MPDGRTHDIITVVTAAAAVPLAMTVPGMTPGQVGILAGSYLLSGIVFSCDLDLRSEPYLRWGRFRFIWWPYQKLVHHRSLWSHGLVVGPVLRLVYFTAVMFALLYLGLSLVNLLHPIDSTGTLRQTWFWLSGYVSRHPIVSVLLLIGFILGGASHSIADVLSTARKRWRRRHPILGRFL